MVQLKHSISQNHTKVPSCTPSRIQALLLVSFILLLLAVNTRLLWNTRYYYDQSALSSLQPPIAVSSNRTMNEKESDEDEPAIIFPAYTQAMAMEAIRTIDWICGDMEPMPTHTQRPFIAFVHVYKTAGSTLRDFFARYTHGCKKSLILVIGCTDVKSKVINSGDNWDNCRLKYTIDARNDIQETDEKKKEERVYPTVNTTILKSQFDVLAGHYRIGMLDYIFPPQSIRHVLFLRQPIDRYVSSILYRANRFDKNKKESVQETAAFIKRSVYESRDRNDYLESILKYLLTPEQKELASKKKTSTREKTQLAIDNLVYYNTIVGMTETFSESMQILSHAFVDNIEYSSDEREDYVLGIMDTYIDDSQSSSTKEKKEVERENENKTATTIRMNISQRGSISTSSVVAELKKDAAFMPVLREFLKYELIVVDFALKMHHMQYDLVVESNR